MKVDVLDSPQGLVAAAVREPEKLCAQGHGLAGLQTRHDLLRVPDLHTRSLSPCGHGSVLLLAVEPASQAAAGRGVPDDHERVERPGAERRTFGQGRHGLVADGQAPREDHRLLLADDQRRRRVQWLVLEDRFRGRDVPHGDPPREAGLIVGQGAFHPVLEGGRGGDHRQHLGLAMARERGLRKRRAGRL